jgi:hypothetical protein
MLRPLAVSLETVIEEQLETGNELFKVDFAISRNSDGVNVPIIFIESENNMDSADHEVRKLVNLAAPLRVLITVAQWDESGIWDGRGGGHRSSLLSRWGRVIRQHQTVWPRAGVVGILIGEWRPNKTFRFYGYGYGEGHRLAVPLSDILLERPAGYEDPRQASAASGSVSCPRRANKDLGRPLIPGKQRIPKLLLKVRAQAAPPDRVCPGDRKVSFKSMGATSRKRLIEC